jgi:hypothetical protein
MLVVKLEVWPNGKEIGKQEIGRLDIGNITRLSEMSDYIYRFRGSAGVADGMVEAHERAKGAWELVRRVLERAAVELERA